MKFSIKTLHYLKNFLIILLLAKAAKSRKIGKDSEKIVRDRERQ